MSSLENERRRQRSSPFGEYALPDGRGAAALASFGLGAAFCVGGWLLASSGPLSTFGAYVVALSAFHQCEYLAVAAWRADTLCFDSFCLNHSTAYAVAAVASGVEYAVESRYYPGWKVWWGVPLLGAGMVAAGHAIRLLAFAHCGSNFSHLVEVRDREDHELVDGGVYAYLRHPAYFGWFWWSIGTQLLLCNPLCAVAYALAANRFFASRIPHEESTLLHFFGESYERYMDRTVVGIPFI